MVTLAVLLIRTYAFFSRKAYVLGILLVALSGVVAYQLYVDATQMLRKFSASLASQHIDKFLVLPFFRPPFVRSNHIGPCFTRSLSE